MKTKATHLQCGKKAEDEALDFLVRQGLTLVTRKYHCKQGELDLIMRDHNVLVFIEVRFRKSNRYDSALESVTASKQGRIIAATQHYLATQTGDSPLRIDLVAMSGDDQIRWIKNAF